MVFESLMFLRKYENGYFNYWNSHFFVNEVTVWLNLNFLRKKIFFTFTPSVNLTKIFKEIIMIKSTLIFAFCFFTVALFSQTQNSSYTAIGKGVATTFLTDYQCLGINNSALGWGTGYKNIKTTILSS